VFISCSGTVHFSLTKYDKIVTSKTLTDIVHVIISCL